MTHRRLWHDLTLYVPVFPLVAAMAVLIGGIRSQAQVGVAIPSNVNQTASVTSKGTTRQQVSAAGPIALPEDFSNLRLAPGFMLEMSVFNAPEMTKSLRVDDAGSVSVPLVGLIHVADDSVRVAEKKIATALVDQEMMVNPSVNLEITAFAPKPVIVAGEVQQPGKLQILAPRAVLDLIASAGGVTTAAGGDIEIHHPQASGPDEVHHIPYTNGNEPTEAREALVYPGDTVYVRRAGVIFVLGAVNHPGGYLMVNGGMLNLPQALTLASGTTVIASTSTAIIVRKHGNTVEQLHVPLTESERGSQPPFPLQDGDMVYVPTSKLKAALVNSSVVLSAAATASIYSVAGR